MKNVQLNKLILCVIPTYVCNLKCEYCFITQLKSWENKDIKFQYSVEHMVKALSRERLDGMCYINLTSQGETLLYKDIVPLTKGLLKEGHFVEIVTNGITTNRIDEILKFPKELLKHLFFKISYHYQELEKYNLKEKFWTNVKKIKESPCSFTIELMPNDTISKDIDKICKDSIKNAGALCHLTVGRNSKNVNKELLTNMTKEEYFNTWKIFDSKMFELKMNLLGVKRKEFCYAGKWSLLIDMATGEASQCYGRMNTQNIFKNIEKPIKFYPVGHSCTQPFCFNGHAHIAWGIIPNLNSPCYYDVRNRMTEDGNNWVKKDCKELFIQKFNDNNKEYSTLYKIGHTIINPFYLFIKLFHNIPEVKRKLKKFYKILTKQY